MVCVGEPGESKIERCRADVSCEMQLVRSGYFSVSEFVCFEACPRNECCGLCRSQFVWKETESFFFLGGDGGEGQVLKGGLGRVGYTWASLRKYLDDRGLDRHMLVGHWAQRLGGRAALKKAVQWVRHWHGVAEGRRSRPSG